MTGRLRASVLAIVVLSAAGGANGLAQEQASSDVTIRLIEVDVRAAVQALAPYIDRPVVFGEIGDGRVTIETPGTIARGDVLGLLEGALATQELELLAEESLYRVVRIEPPEASDEAGAGVDAAAGPVQLYVIHLRHARANDVAGTVNALYGRAALVGEIAERPATLSEGLRENLVDPVDVPPDARPVVTTAARFEGDVTIVPDARTNSLLIRATAADYELIAAAVGELDVRPLQVLIEVLIAEVRRDRNLSYGLETILPPYRPDPDSDTEIEGSLDGLGLGDFILRVMNFGGLDLTGILRAAASRGDASILSRPVVIAANNEPASFLVGTERPFVQVSRSLPTDTPTRDQVVQYREVGTRLLVTPTISDDGYVMLEVVQEVNAATSEIAFEAPVISTRTVETQLLVKDGHTAVLGGLADRQVDVTRGGLPILSDLPIVGGLFGRRIERETETELFLFLTPRVIRTDGDLEGVTRDASRSTRRLRRHLEDWFDRPQDDPEKTGTKLQKKSPTGSKVPPADGQPGRLESLRPENVAAGRGSEVTPRAGRKA